MAVQRTLTIIKPDAVAKGVAGQIIARFEQAGLRVLAAKLVHLTATQAGGFYIVHRERPFYGSLCAFTHEPGYFVRLGFSLVPHAWLPEKIAVDCAGCALFRHCGQDAVRLDLAPRGRRS